MRQREYVTAVGSNVGALATTGVGKAQPVALERVHPAESETAVRSEDRIGFEVAATPGVDPTATDWVVDGRTGVRSNRTHRSRDYTYAPFLLSLSRRREKVLSVSSSRTES
ncbi:hypothetical protein [Natrinema pallidum]|uniref:hypothetical protein n=1 Tax=Natrinema pallidum TaxID=69527 RepID=UPI001586AD2D|nr:hypothetical protein [Natrinema pallidum]